MSWTQTLRKLSPLNTRQPHTAFCAWPCPGMQKTYKIWTLLDQNLVDNETSRPSHGMKMTSLTNHTVSKICIKRFQILIIFILEIFVVVARVSFPNGQLHTGNIHVGSALDTHKIPTHKRFQRMLFIRTKHNITMLAIILGSNFWTHNFIYFFMHGFVHVRYILPTAKFELKMMERTSHANTGSSVWCCCVT